ncbi:MAG: hypothetical protein CL908_07735 [Deltaproteobacteria bacterium]|jgi:hypothetical protein|nr:hypothetical protein [Deltaproteobacteria bacterium]
MTSDRKLGGESIRKAQGVGSFLTQRSPRCQRIETRIGRLIIFIHIGVSVSSIAVERRQRHFDRDSILWAYRIILAGSQELDGIHATREGELGAARSSD